MKRFLTVLILLGMGGACLEAAVDLKALWRHSRTPAKRPITSLWNGASSSGNHPQSTVKKIEDSRSTLHRTSQQKAQANQQLERIARAIRNAEMETIAINKVLDRLERDQQKSETKYQTAKASIDRYGGEIQKLDTTIKGKHEAFIRLLTEQFSLIAALETINRPTLLSVVQREVYEAFKKKNAHELRQLKTQIDGSRKVKAKLLSDREHIRRSIRAIIAKRTLYEEKKKEKARLLATLARKEEEYRAQLKAIMQRQESLQQTLAKLNILHREEIASARREAEAKRAELRRKTAELKRMRQQQAAQARRDKAAGKTVTYTAPEIRETLSAVGHVKQYGSSYQHSNIQAYRGPRTIAPLSHARVVKKFGPYIDPIYKIRIFNDNIILKASRPNAKVRNVLNGRVVYIGRNNMLGKVVIIEHGNRLHTIYAALDRISPLLQKGSRVKKGTIIGRVKRKLIFQATQNSRYINPLRLIQL